MTAVITLCLSGNFWKAIKKTFFPYFYFASMNAKIYDIIHWFAGTNDSSTKHLELQCCYQLFHDTLCICPKAPKILTFTTHSLHDLKARGFFPRGSGGAMVPPDFGTSVNPISTRGGGQLYPQHCVLLTFSYFQIFLRPCN